jgi:hypothetical protein
LATLKDLKPDPRNARKRTDRSASLIQESLQRFGAARSIVIDEDGRILAGNGTVEGAKAAGINKVRIIETEGDEIVAVRRTGLTEEQKIGLALADNRTSDLSEWDGLMLQQLSETHDVSPWFEPEDLEAIIGSDEKDESDAENPYTDKTDVPPYEITGPKPEVSSTYDDTKARKLIEAIDGSSLPADEKHLLKAAAYRHVVFNFQSIAEYYAHSEADVQKHMEDSALVIVDLGKAIEEGWARLGKELGDLAEQDINGGGDDDEE